VARYGGALGQPSASLWGLRSLYSPRYLHVAMRFASSGFI